MSAPAEPAWKLGPPDQPGWYLTEYRLGSGAWAGNPKTLHWHRAGSLVWYTETDTPSPGPRADHKTSGDWSSCADQVRTFGPGPGPEGR